MPCNCGKAKQEARERIMKKMEANLKPGEKVVFEKGEFKVKKIKQ